MSNTVRLATVKATGSRYVVSRLVIASPRQAGRVFCWGEVTAVNGRSMQHGASKTFASEAVVVAEVERTTAELRS